MTQIDEDIVSQNACYVGFSACFLDTFYVDTLEALLQSKFRANTYAVLAVVDSVDVTLVPTYDSQGNIIDHLDDETVHISILENYRETLPFSEITLKESWLYDSTKSYSAMIGDPFLAFFTEFDSLYMWGIGPSDGCFFEPTGFFIIDEEIHYKGNNVRMPGVSVPLSDIVEFMNIPVQEREIPFKASLDNPLPEMPFEAAFYSLDGRLVHRGRYPGGSEGLSGVPLKEAVYLVRLKTKGYERSVRVAVAGGRSGERMWP